MMEVTSVRCKGLARLPSEWCYRLASGGGERSLQGYPFFASKFYYNFLSQKQLIATIAA